MDAIAKPNVNKIVGQNIRWIRRERKVKMEAIAQALSISIPAYSKFETGITDINFSRLKQIAAYYAVPIEKLIDLTWEPAEDLNVPFNFEEQRIRQCNEEIIILQQKVISLLEEIECKP